MIPQREKKINELKYALYVVSTPIGNLKRYNFKGY